MTPTDFATWLRETDLRPIGNSRTGFTQPRKDVAALAAQMYEALKSCARLARKEDTAATAVIRDVAGEAIQAAEAFKERHDTD